MTTRTITLTALFVAIGIVVPQLFHMIGGPTIGSIVLPMHFPVFIGAMLLGPRSGAIIAVLSVGVGFLLGMPPLIIASYMVFELVVYAMVSGFLYYNRKMNIYVSFVVAKLFGMTTALVVTWVMLHWLGFTQIPVFGKLTMFAPGIPGMIAQIVLIPPTVYLLQKSLVGRSQTSESL